MPDASPGRFLARRFLDCGRLPAAPEAYARKLDHGVDAFGELVIGRGDTSELFGLVEESLDAVARLVEPAAEADALLAGAPGGDIGGGTVRFDQFTFGVGIGG